jgi:polygalacturonase
VARNRIVNGDDSLCVKSPGSNILFEDNYAEQGNGIVIGTSSDAQISNITYRNCVSNRTAYGMHIKFKDNQTGHVTGVLYDNLTVIQPYKYVMGINQNDQLRRRRRTQVVDDVMAHDEIEYHTMANVSISDITYRNIRTVGGKALSAGLFQCDVLAPVNRTVVICLVLMRAPDIAW